VIQPAARPLEALTTLVPRRRLLLALLGGAALVALTFASPLVWALAVAYHAALAWAIVGDARKLPRPDRFVASRQLPEPLSLGAE